MKMKHILIEGYCDGKKSVRDYPCEGRLNLGTHCITCTEFSYTQSPHELALSNEDGVIEELEDFIGFGGDMEPENDELRDVFICKWRDICKEKINEAYIEYMEMLASPHQREDN